MLEFCSCHNEPKCMGPLVFCAVPFDNLWLLGAPVCCKCNMYSTTCSHSASEPRHQLGGWVGRYCMSDQALKTPHMQNPDIFPYFEIYHLAGRTGGTWQFPNISNCNSTYYQTIQLHKVKETLLKCIMGNTCNSWIVRPIHKKRAYIVLFSQPKIGNTAFYNNKFEVAWLNLMEYTLLLSLTLYREICYLQMGLI